MGQRSDGLLLAFSAALYGLIIAVAWRANPSRGDVEIVLFLTAGALEAAGVGLTAWDVRDKMRQARTFEQPGQPATEVLRVLAEAQAASTGTATRWQLERLNRPLLAALDGRKLAVAASLLLAGIVLGTVANVLGATG